jgi:DNA-binding response OmpR family regulator
VGASTIGIPFIFLTASKDAEYRKRAAELGAAAYFEKPYDPEQLLTTIESILTKPPSKSAESQRRPLAAGDGGAYR